MSRSANVPPAGRGRRHRSAQCDVPARRFHDKTVIRTSLPVHLLLFSCRPGKRSELVNNHRFREKGLIVKIKNVACLMAAVALFVGCETEKNEHDQAKLQSMAKVTKEDAQKTALARVPNGTVQEAELEKEHGKVIWSFDIAVPGSKDISEVEVDAVTGEVVAMEKESPEEQAKEAKEKDKD
jgi:uncharacterized membrane protein YkoI